MNHTEVYISTMTHHINTVYELHCQFTHGKLVGGVHSIILLYTWYRYLDGNVSVRILKFKNIDRSTFSIRTPLSNQMYNWIVCQLETFKCIWYEKIYDNYPSKLRQRTFFKLNSIYMVYFYWDIKVLSSELGGTITR